MNAPLAKEQIALLMSDSLTYRGPAVESARPSALQRLMAACRRALAALRALGERRAVLDTLSSLSDHELADIGLNRSELGHVFDRRFIQARRDPSV